VRRGEEHFINDLSELAWHEMMTGKSSETACCVEYGSLNLSTHVVNQSSLMSLQFADRRPTAPAAWPWRRSLARSSSDRRQDWRQHRFTSPDRCFVEKMTSKTGGRRLKTSRTAAAVTRHGAASRSCRRRRHRKILR